MGRKDYLKFYRSMLNHPLWLAEPFTKGQAFWDLVAGANHADGKVICGNVVVEVKRGQNFTSELKMAERWKWSRNKVRAYLKLLENLEMATANGTAKGTLITIENYEIYQGEQTDEGATLNTAQGQGKVQHKDSKETSKGTQTRRTKKKQEETKKDLYGEYRNVKMSAEDMNKLMKEFPTDYMDRIERLSEYMASTGKTYKSHLATIRSWARKGDQKSGGYIPKPNIPKKYIPPAAKEKTGMTEEQRKKLSEIF